jgi:polysaccharide biosynthesis transport protein
LRERLDIASEFRRIVRVLRRQAPIIVICVLVAGGVAYALADRKKPVYEASAQLLITAYSPDLSLPNAPALFSDPTRGLATALQLVTGPQVAQRVFAQLHLRTTSATKISASSAGDSDVLFVTVQDRNAQEAALLANAYASQYVAFRRDTNAGRYLAAAQLIVTQLATDKVIKPTSTGGHVQPLTPAQVAHNIAIGVLRDQARRLRLYAATQTGDAQIVQPAGVARAAVPTHKIRYAGLGGLFGALLGLALAFLREQFNDRITREEELEELAPELDVIGYIAGGRGRRSATVAGEGFHNLAANLDSLLPAGQSRAILITSPSAQDGKSTTAVNLALALAERQDSVLLIEADLRRPKISERLSLNAHKAGVAEVLAGQRTLVESVERVSFSPTKSSADGPRVVLTGELPVVFAGGDSARPHALINDRTSTELLRSAREQAQSVIIDGPPLGVVADMLPVAKRSDGVIVVVRLNQTRPRDLGRMLKQLESAQVKPLGVVILGAETGEYYG